MKNLITILIVCVIQLFLEASASHAHHGGATAYAIPLEGITIDGNLDDWPEDMIRYPILNTRRVYGATDIELDDLTTSPDVSPYFMVGFSKVHNLIYLAIHVRDDSLVVVSPYQHIDNCEVYFEGIHSGKSVKWNSDLTMQYVMCPPGGKYSGLQSTDNPMVMNGDITKTKTLGAFSRHGDITIYEWALEAFDQFPGSPTKLKLGKTIGFDVTVTDSDDNNRSIISAAWICWAPYGTIKKANANFMGDLVLLESVAALGTIEGKVTRNREGTPWLGAEVIVHDRKGIPKGSGLTNADGMYKIWINSGSYRVTVMDAKGIHPLDVTVKPGEHLHDISFAPSAILDKYTVTLLEGLKFDAEKGRESFLTRDLGKKLNMKITFPTLHHLLQNDEDPKIRNAALIFLQQLWSANPKYIVPILIKTLQEDQDPIVRRSAVQPLGYSQYFKSKSITIPALIEALNDNDAEVRRWAAYGLSRFGSDSKTGVAVLIQKLQDDNTSVRQSACFALGSIGADAETAVPALLEVLKDEDSSIINSAVYALGEIGIGSPDVITSLIETLTDDDSRVRQSAALSLGKIGPKAKNAVYPLIQVLKEDDDSNARGAAGWALGNIGIEDKAAVTAFLETLKKKDMDANAWSGIAQALGNIGHEYTDIIPLLTKGLQHENHTVRFYSTGSLKKISLSIFEYMKNFKASEIKILIGQFETAKSEFEKAEILPKGVEAVVQFMDGGSYIDGISIDIHDYILSDIIKGTSDALNGAIASLKAEYESRLFIQFQEWVIEHELHRKPWVWVVSVYLLIVVTCLITWLMLLWNKPLWLYTLNRKLRYPEFNPDWIGISFGFRQLLLLSFFNYHPRVLDAWVKDNFKKARDQFENLQTVQERSIHVSIPVTIDGQTIDQPSADKFRSIFSKERFCLLIWGEGGSGKTSLACRLAQWSMSEDSEKPLSGHLMFPVLIEHDLHETLREQKHPLLQAIHSQVELITEDDEIEPEFMRHLLKKQRILVIFDRLSEMNADTRKLVRLGYDPELKINALIITSRLKESMHGALINTVEPLRIDKEHLLPFMVTYLKNEDFEDSDYFDACSRLSKVAGYRGITALMAKLYAEQLITVKKEVTSIEDLPDSIPDLMLGYLNWINRNRTDKDPDHRTIHRISKIIAWASLEETFHPSDASLSVIQSALPEEQDLNEKLSYISEKLGLIRFVGHSLNRIRFTLDPLSEYLAGLRLLELYGSENEQWRRFIAEADQKEGAPEAIDDFLTAVIDCCQSEGKAFSIPDFVVEELNSRVKFYEMAV